MKPEELTKPTVSVAYVLLTLQLAEERGLNREQLLKNMQISPEMLERPEARFPLLQYGQICVRALKMTGDPALGYEFGLRMNLTTHGLVGFGMISHATLREVINFTGRFFGPLRLPGWDVKFSIEGSQAVLEAHETVPYGLLRQYAVDMLLVSFVSTLRQFLPPQPAIEIWFDCPEPDYYTRYRERLPPTRFSMGVNQLRFPAEYLDLPTGMANAVTAKLVTQQCERELALLGRMEDVLERVRAELVNEQGRYPDLETVAERLSLSSRTLKRRLHEHGFSFQHLLDEARHRDSVRLLENHSLSLEEIADHLGYSTPANFSRAFSKWTGSTPGSFRKQLRS